MAPTQTTDVKDLARDIEKVRAKLLHQTVVSSNGVVGKVKVHMGSVEYKGPNIPVIILRADAVRTTQHIMQEFEKPP